MWAQIFGASPICGPVKFLSYSGVWDTGYIDVVLKVILELKTCVPHIGLSQKLYWPTHRTSSEYLCPHFGLAPRFFVFAPHFRSAHGAGGGGGTNLLTLRMRYYNEV